ncbi:cGMP-specific 3',5'-cyclic phosphodiesterase [Homalodisca vitripennis]|nr:cGMP-specific 3',5'-cyclic phosphodiesterase [Homalodisca vitripennis]
MFCISRAVPELTVREQKRELMDRLMCALQLSRRHHSRVTIDGNNITLACQWDTGRPPVVAIVASAPLHRIIGLFVGRHVESSWLHVRSGVEELRMTAETNPVAPPGGEANYVKTYDSEYARMEAWLDEHPDFVQDYFLR